MRRLKHFKPITNTCVDSMHSGLEGIGKKFFSICFSSENSSHPSNMRKFDKRLLQIRPPKFVPSTPRSIYSHNLWRAHEYLSFFLYYALAVFKDIIPLDFYQHLKKFILFLETILSPKMNVAYLKRVEIVLIFEFNILKYKNVFYRQIKGIAMGSKSGPSIANIFVFIFEKEFLRIHRPIFYKRFIDDIFMIIKKGFNFDLQ